MNSTNKYVLHKFDLLLVLSTLLLYSEPFSMFVQSLLNHNLCTFPSFFVEQKGDC
jgi:hypothetical protein